MHSFKVAVAAALGVAAITLGAPAPAIAASSPWVLTATSTAAPYAPTFTGNGLLGVRVPAAGQGYAPGTVPADSELAGFYAQPPGQVQQRANLPTWSTLTFATIGAAQTTDWQQSIDLHTGVITTSMRVSDSRGATDLTYRVLTDRALPELGLVQLTLSPHWSGVATVTDTIDGTPATMSTGTGTGANSSAGQIWVTVRTLGTGITAALASQLTSSAPIALRVPPPPVPAGSQSNQQTIGVDVTAGHSYTFTKYVAVVSSQSSATPLAGALKQASAAAATGWSPLVSASNDAWAALWQDRVDVLGDPALAAMVNASEFYLWSSTRAGVDWSVSPAGLSSNGYDGHIFWDAETWMYPSLLALHPDLAVGMDNYRFDRLAAAEQHATATGYRGARFPWESALDGTEQIPPPVTTNSEGLYEQHITADIALAQWQYYLATGDRHWLATRGWPVISAAAAFWASRVRRAPDGSYHIYGVTGPDEENPDVNDEVYTNAGAMRTLQDATAAAAVLHLHAPAAWMQIASHMTLLVSRHPLHHPEFASYRGQMVKQADVTLLEYPWALPLSPQMITGDLNYYVPRSDPSGPSMSDAVNEIDTSAVGTPGCSAYVYTVRSFQPFIRDPFDQFSETRTGGAFTFMTGIGGFLQEFLYGYSGLRLQSNEVVLDPSLTAQLPGLVLRGLNWHGRLFTVAIGPRTTTVTLQSGAPLPLATPTGLHAVHRGHRLVIPTRRPDLIPTTDALRCARVTSSSAALGAPALAAVDGSPATGWQPTALPARLTVALRGAGRLMRGITVLWGHQWPSPPKTPNVPPAPGPVITLRPSAYIVQVSSNGRHWITVARIGARSGALDRIAFARRRVRDVRLIVTGASSSTLPLLEELTSAP